MSEVVGGAIVICASHDAVFVFTDTSVGQVMIGAVISGATVVVIEVDMLHPLASLTV